jgi:hypothetical protein
MSRSWIVAVGVCVAALISITMPPAANAAVTAGSLWASPNSVTSSAVVRFAGSLPTKVKRPFVLQRKTASGWSSVTGGRTTRKGKISVATAAPSAAGSYAYRVTAKKFVAGGRAYKAIKTPTAGLRVAPAPGSRENPLAINTPFQSASWRFNIGRADFDAWPEIAAENMFNDPPPAGWSYVTVPVTYTYLGSGTGQPFWDTNLEFVGNDGLVYDEGVNGIYCGVVPNQTSDMPDMFAGATATGNECVPVPTHAIAGGVWRATGETLQTNWVYVTAN